MLKDEFMLVPQFANKAVKFDQELKKLRDGHYRNTMMLGNSIRKFLNNLFTMPNSTPLISSKVGQFIGRFEDSFAGLDNKTLFEESKFEGMGSKRKSSGMGGKKKSLQKKNSRSNLLKDKPMTDEEKKILSRNIRNLTAEQLKGIIKIVRDMFPEKDGMLEFDIDTLPPNK